MLQKIDRLTYRTAGDATRAPKNTSNKTKQELVDRLAEYEETGRTPAEIYEMARTIEVLQEDEG